jgi:hypothetical protein
LAPDPQSAQGAHAAPEDNGGAGLAQFPRGSRAILELHVGEMKQLFNAMDPSPFRERDLDPKAEAYILDWGRETPAGQPLGLVVHLSRDRAGAEGEGVLRDAVREYFRHRARATRQQLRRLLRVGRISLLIGLAFLAAAIFVGDLLAGLVRKESFGGILKESLVIGGWVALWRPIEIFLYDWWPIRAEARLNDRLGDMDVRVIDANAAAEVPP